MALIKDDFPKKHTIDLRGPQGNAYYLLGTASKLANRLGLDAKAIDADMTSGDYRRLVEVFDKHFGEIYDLLLPENWEEAYPRDK